MSGRPSKYSAALHNEMLRLYETGLTDAQVAWAVGISVRTIYTWKAGNFAFSQSVQDAKKVPDEVVESCLMKRATGYFEEVEEVFCLDSGKVVRVPTIKYCPPSVSAAIFWLRNRAPDKWR